MGKKSYFWSLSTAHYILTVSYFCKIYSCCYVYLLFYCHAHKNSRDREKLANLVEIVTYNNADDSISDHDGTRCLQLRNELPRRESQDHNSMFLVYHDLTVDVC